MDPSSSSTMFFSVGDEPTQAPPPPYASRPAQSRWKCDVCDARIRNETDWAAHMASKKHHRKTQEMEQCAVLVHGLPETAGPAAVRRLLPDFHVHEDGISFVPSPPAGLAAPGLPPQEVEPFWHVQLASVDEARRAVRDAERVMDGWRVTLSFAVHPVRCTICQLSLNSGSQLQQHLTGARHQEMVRRHVARCGLLLKGVSLAATPADVAQLFCMCSIAEGGILMLGPAGQDDVQNVHVTFSSEEEADRAFQLRDQDLTLCGARVRIAQRQSLPSVEPPEVPMAGEKTPEEARLAVRAFLQSKGVRDVGALTRRTFGHAVTFLLSSKPPALRGVAPKDLFLTEFDRQAGGKQGSLPCHRALAIIQPLRQAYTFTLPKGVEAWLQDKLAKYPHDAEVNKGAFVQMRDVICQAYQATQEVAACLAMNETQSPPPLPP
eukprot:EG_transcript_13340